MRGKQHREVTSGTPIRPGWALIIWCDPLPCTGGVCQVVLNLANELNVHGTYRPVVIVNEWAAARPRMETRAGVQYVFLRMREPPDNSVRLFKRILGSISVWRESRRILRLIRTLNIQVINSHYPTLAGGMFVAGRCTVAGRPVKVIFSLHGMDIVGAADWPEYLARYVFMLAHGNAVVAVSHAFAELVKCVAPPLACKVSVIHNGVSAETIRNYEPMNAALPARYILNVATFEAKKGQCHLVTAFSQIAGVYPDLHLVLAGRDGGALNDLTRQVSHLGLDERVLFLLDVPHAKIGALFASATLFCLSSLAEPFGIVLLEAGVFSLPVVATRVGGVPEVIRDKKDGILVDGGDSTQLADGIRALLDAPDLAGAFGASLHERVLREFSWRQAVERYVSLAASR
jgi:glycosyltransferase involved in cell wall biosynthesis